MDRDDSSNLTQLVTIVSIAFVIGVLYFAKQVLQPLAMSILLTFLFAPLVARLQRLGFGRVPAVLATIALACLVFLGIGWIVVSQISSLAGKLPEYQNHLSARIQALRGTDSPILSEVNAMFNELVDEATGSLEPDAAGRVTAARPPVRVTVVESGPLPLRMLRDWVGPVLSPFGTFAVILLFMIFMLIYHENLRDRMIRLAGIRKLSATTQALDEAGRRVSSYLVKLSFVNSTYGLGVAIGLWIIGIPSAFLWGLVATVLRFVPYVGPWIAATLPIALSLAAFDGWLRPLATIGLFVVLELVSNNIIEPWLYGQGTGVSTVGIITAALFWTWLWGPLGLVLSMPLTVCLTVLGRYAPGMSFVTILFSDEPALEVKLRFYQRLLAMDYHEATDIVDEFLTTGSVQELYSSVLMPALSLAEGDRQKDQLADAQRQFIYKFIRTTLEDLAGAQPFQHHGETADEHAPPLPVYQSSAGLDHHVLCLPAEDDGDELAGELVAQSLQARGYSARTISSQAVHEALEQSLRGERIDSVVISAVAPGGALSARDLCRRLRSKSPQLRIIVGLWNAGGELTKTRQRLATAGASGVATRLVEAVTLLQDLSDTKGQVVPTGTVSQ